MNKKPLGVVLTIVGVIAIVFGIVCFASIEGKNATIVPDTLNVGFGGFFVLGGIVLFAVGIAFVTAKPVAPTTYTAPSVPSPKAARERPLKSAATSASAATATTPDVSVEAEDYLDIRCPYCGAELSFLPSQFKYGSSICPECDRKITFSRELLR